MANLHEAALHRLDLEPVQIHTRVIISRLKETH